MRDYDDYEDENIRLYTPVLQRVIVLAAVIVAVPVVMWTITTFVRSYVARPKVPALERVASTSASVPIAAVAAEPPAPASSNQSTPVRSNAGAAREAPTSPNDIKKSPTNLAALPDSPAASAAANAPSAAPLQADLRQADLGQPSSPAVTGTAIAAASDAASDAGSAAAPTASLPRLPQAARPTENVTLSSAASPADRSIAWPNPNTASPPDFSASRRSTAPTPPPARVAAVEVLPSDQPIRGAVPLPRQRPGIVAIAASSGASGRAVPLPRVRPVGAAVETASTFSALPSGARPELESAH